MIKKIEVAFLITLIIILALSVRFSTSKHGKAEAFGRTAAVIAAVNQIIVNKEVPGISPAVFNAEKILFQKSMGPKNVKTGEPVDASTAFEAASLSKTLFAYILVSFVHDGKILLDRTNCSPDLFFGLIKNKFSNHIIIIWNILGLGLLLNIVMLAILSAKTPFQQFAFEQPNIAVAYFPFNWLPSVVVPLVLFSHLVTLKQLININKTNTAHKLSAKAGDTQIPF